MTWESEPEVLLRRGWWTGQQWEQRVHLRPVDDSAEESLLERIEGMLSVDRDTALLGSLVCGPEGNAITRTQFLDLSMGDRELLLLLVRRRLFGNIMQCVLKCPSCDEKLDVELKVDDLIVESNAVQQIRYEELIEAEGTWFRVTFHLPTAGDVEKALRPAADIEGTARALARGCIDSVSRVSDEPGSTQEEKEEWPDSVLRKISARIEQLDPQAEIELQSNCPACGYEFKQPVDPGGYLVHELAARQRVKYQEVHELARAYHWSEAEILSMGSRKRQIYLDLLAAAYE
jgi:hypothetical protein